MTWELANRANKEGEGVEAAAAAATKETTPPRDACPFLNQRKRPRGISLLPRQSRAVHLLSADGDRVPLTSLWAERRVLLVFVRDFGCIFCKQMGGELAAFQCRLAQEQVGLVIIGIGSPAQAKEFKETAGFKDDVYVDENPLEPASHALFSLGRSESEAAVYGDERVKAAYKEALAAGYTNDEPDARRGGANLLMHGGVFAMGPGTLACDFAYRNEFVGDMPNLKLAVEIATGILESGGEYVFPVTEMWVESLRMTERANTATCPPTATASDASKPKNAHRALEPLSQDPYVKAGVGVGAVAAAATESLALGVCGVVLLALVIAAVRVWRYQQSLKIPCTKMYTVREIDELAAKYGCDEADSAWLEATDMVTLATEEKKPDQPLFKTLDAAHQSVRVRSCEDLAPLQQAVCYLREFLAKPHPLLGRSGATCPFVPGSLRMNTLWLAKVYATEEDSIDDIKTVVRGFIEQFKKLQPITGPKSLYRTLIMIFPCIPLERASEYIDGVQLALKAETVKQAMMIGEFHMYNNAASLRNDDFYPLRTPYPSLALRAIVPGDLVFLKPDKYPAAMREEMLSSFVNHFDTEEGRTKISSTDLDIAKEDLQRAQDDLAKEGLARA